MRKRALLVLSLGLFAASAGAQTLLDTSAAIGISNTLNQNLTAPNIQPPKLTQSLQGQPAANGSEQVQITRQAPASAPSNADAVEIRPLTTAQSEELRAALENLDAGANATAQQGFERVISQNYRQPEPHFGLAIALLAQGETEAARFEFNQLLKLAPERYEAPYNLGVLAQRDGNNAAALEYFTQAASLAASETPSIQLMVLDALAGVQTQMGDFTALQATLEQMYALLPNDPAAALRLAQVQSLNGMGADTLPLAYEALAGDKTRAAAASLLADIYMAQNLPERAMSEVEAALNAEGDPLGRSVLLTRRSALLDSFGRLDEAKADALQAARLAPENAAAYAQVGAVRSKLGDVAGAVAAYREAARLAPNNGFYRTELGLLRLGLGQRQAARNDALLALRLDDPQMQSRGELLLGLLAYRAGHYAQAIGELESSIAKVPSAQAYYWLGLATYAQGDYASSAEALSKSAQLDPQVQTRVSLGNALIAQGRYSEAEALLQGVTAEAPSQAEAWYLLGIAQREMGQTAAAMKSFRVGADLGEARARRAMQ